MLSPPTNGGNSGELHGVWGEAGLESVWAWGHRGRAEKEKVTNTCFSTAGEFAVTFCLGQNRVSPARIPCLSKYKPP